MDEKDNVTEQLKELITVYSFNKNTLSQYLGLPLDRIDDLSNGNINFLPDDCTYRFKLFNKIKLGITIINKIKDYNKCCSYITKYITKSCCRTDSGRVYFCSRGLKRAEEELMIDTDLNTIFDNVFQNDYCQKKDFDITRLSEQQKLKLNRYFNLNDEILQQDNNYITNYLKLFTNFYNNYNIRVHK